MGAVRLGKHLNWPDELIQGFGGIFSGWNVRATTLSVATSHCSLTALSMQLFTHTEKRKNIVACEVGAHIQRLLTAAALEQHRCVEYRLDKKCRVSACNLQSIFEST